MTVGVVLLPKLYLLSGINDAFLFLGEAFSPFQSQSGSDSEPSLNPELVREALSHVATSSATGGSGSEGGSEGGSEAGLEASAEVPPRKRAGGWTSSEDEASDWDGEI